MNFISLVIKSLRQHFLSTLTSVISLALGVSLMVTVVSLRNQTHIHFTRVGLGVDAVLGPKGSPLQIVLNSIYHLEEMPGKVPWRIVEELKNQNVVERVIPFCSGHSFGGFRVNAIDSSFFNNFEYLPGKYINFDSDSGGQGRAFAEKNLKEAVAGWEAAKKLGIKPGDSFNPVCGVNIGGSVHRNDRLVFVGIMARTGTPHDRAIYVPLEKFFTLEGHDNSVVQMAVNKEKREISGALVSIRKIRGGIMHPGVRDLKFMLNKNPAAQLIIPNEVLPQLFNIIGWIDYLLLGLSILVVLNSSAFLFVSLINALRERRRDYALLRCLGASKSWVFGLIMTESLFISTFGGLLGIFLGRMLIFSGTRLIQSETGMSLDPMYLCSFDILILPAIIIFGQITAFIPAFRAYSLNALHNLHPQS
ncbi:MAG: ABC transporter permease [Candidatus Riflebacteria bacterium]|nr:ABC transporter permease [Candidatus Riflebacteria bacterium]